MILITQDILVRIRRSLAGISQAPVVVKNDLQNYVDLERRALLGHINEVRTRSELVRDADNWLDMLSLQWDLFTESRIRLRRDQQARRIWRHTLYRHLRTLVLGAA